MRYVTTPALANSSKILRIFPPQNDMLCDDIYMAMPWEKMYPSEKKLMLLPLLRTQREISLKGLYFVINVNLLVFVGRGKFFCFEITKVQLFFADFQDGLFFHYPARSHEGNIDR